LPEWRIVLRVYPISQVIHDFFRLDRSGLFCNEISN
jgi:hypothetical protein